MKPDKVRFQVLCYLLSVVMLVAGLILSLRIHSHRSTVAEVSRFEAIVKIRQTKSFQSSDVIGWSWKRGTRNWREVAYKFFADGSLIQTITEADRSYGGPNLNWEILDGTLMISDFRKHPLFKYRILQVKSNDIYVRGPEDQVTYFLRYRD